MFYSDYAVKTLVNAELTLARLVIERTVVKLARRPGERWHFDSAKIVGGTGPTINPGWKMTEAEDRLVDFDEKNESDVFEDFADALRQSAMDFGLSQEL